MRILRILWRQGEATVAEVHETLLKENAYAYTTIATMLKKMEARDLVRHRMDGRAFVYSPAVGEEDVTRNMTEDLLDRLFQGSLPRMVSHLLDTRQVSRKELAQLEKLIAQRKEKR